MTSPTRQHHQAGHDDAHGDHAHAHRHGSDASDESRMGWAAVIIGTFMIVEIIGGLISGSLALLADAGHMVSDTAALGIGWLAIRTAKKPADKNRTYGYQRVEVLAAFVNGCALFA